MSAYRDKRVVIMGLGQFGGAVGAARYLAERGADVLVTDLGEAEALRSATDQLSDLAIEYRLGEHRTEDFTAADLIVVNPAVDRRDNPYLHAAQTAGARLTSEIDLLIDAACRGVGRRRTVGVTGTAGKSTTVAMIGRALRAGFGEQRVHVGGNLGGSLLTELDRIRDEDWIVLELSSFMLETIHDWSPHIAVVTNFAANHLDRHRTLDAYARAKQTALRHQDPGDRAVLGPSVWNWRLETPAVAVEVDAPLDLALKAPGEHNRMNAALAVAAAEAAGVGRDDAAEAVAGFEGLPHRLRLVAERGGVRYYDDSKSTTPASAMLAIDSFDPGTVHVILGGYDKRADMTAVARHAADRCRAIYAIGQTGPAIADAAEQRRDETRADCPVERCGDLAIAVAAAVDAAQSGEVVVLSPGCASWDQFPNFEHRGRRFAELALSH
jgi:UDP-N-acetylmuramoylalanine--D-glutamate ligase